MLLWPLILPALYSLRSVGRILSYPTSRVGNRIVLIPDILDGPVSGLHDFFLPCVETLSQFSCVETLSQFSEMLSVEVQAELLKEKGNEYYSRDKLGAAIDAYTEAIALCPTVPTYWTNRAICHKRRQDWERVRADCQKALELDRTLFKAHRLLGHALVQIKHYAEAIRSLQRALELGSGAGLPPSNTQMMEAERDLLQAKYEDWVLHSRERREKQRKLKERLQQLLKEDLQRRLQGTGAAPDSNGSSPAQSKRSVWRWGGAQNESKAGADAMEAEGHEIVPREDEESGTLEEQHQQLLNTLENVFDAAAAPDIPGEVPEFLCCKITMEIFRDPVVTPSGITYERSVLLDHLARGRNFDPLTRGPLEEARIAPNLAMKEAVEHFLEKHGWAHNCIYRPSPED